MSNKPVGIVGRFVSIYGIRNGLATTEVCEVMAVGMVGSNGYWPLLLATSNGELFSKSAEDCKLVAQPDTGGPYR